MYGLDTFEQIAIWAVLVIAIIGLLYAVLLRSQVLKEDKGTPEMQKVWNAIRDGANAYLRRQLVTILPLIAILTIALFASIYIVPPSPEASLWYCMVVKGAPAEMAEHCAESLSVAENQQIRLFIGMGRAFAFVLGAGFSLAVGQIGMRMAVQGLVTLCGSHIVLGR
jgi:K(+)-stimulated pyrophosphate-energized sodium pump